MPELDEPGDDQDDDQDPDASEPVFGARLVIATVMVASVVLVALVIGFGMKTSCTDDAATTGFPESQCDVIDRWAWGGVVASLVIGLAHVGVGRRFLPLGITVPATLAVAVLMLTGMSLVV